MDEEAKGKAVQAKGKAKASPKAKGKVKPTKPPERPSGQQGPQAKARPKGAPKRGSQLGAKRGSRASIYSQTSQGPRLSTTSQGSRAVPSRPSQARLPAIPALPEEVEEDGLDGVEDGYDQAWDEQREVKQPDMANGDLDSQPKAPGDTVITLEAAPKENGTDDPSQSGSHVCGECQKQTSQGQLSPDDGEWYCDLCWKKPHIASTPIANFVRRVSLQRMSLQGAPIGTSIPTPMPSLPLPDNAKLVSSDVVAHPEAFEVPCPVVAVSGGTACFFRVRYKEGLSPLGPDANECFIGKDLARAIDEIDFYDELRNVARADSDDAIVWQHLSRVCMACPGSVSLECMEPPTKKDEKKKDSKNSKHSKDSKPEVVQPKIRDLLLLENLNCGFKKLRLCDVKMGEHTAVGGWKGKSHFRAERGRQLDMRTNSFVEGFRLEGMDHFPPALQARQDCIGKNVVQSAKQARRWSLQNMYAAEFLNDFLDMSEFGHGAEQYSCTAAETLLDSVAVILQVLQQLPVPQQWIGSSLALGLEVSSISEEPRVLGKIFDWGRSEFNTLQKHQSLSKAVRKERLKYWRQYTVAFSRVTWELARLIIHRFGCVRWSGMAFELRTEKSQVGLGKGPAYAMAVLELPELFDVQVDENASEKDLKLPFLSNTPGKDGSGASSLNITARFVSSSSQPGHGTLTIKIKSLDLHTELCKRFASASKGHRISSIRVVAFQTIEDFNRHVNEWTSGKPEPQPEGHAFARIVNGPQPETAKDGTACATWDQFVEFVGIGEERAKQVEIRASKALGVPLEEKGPNVTWPAMLPPIVGEQAKNNSLIAFTRFLDAAVPWTMPALYPPPGANGSKIQHDDPSLEDGNSPIHRGISGFSGADSEAEPQSAVTFHTVHSGYKAHPSFFLDTDIPTKGHNTKCCAVM